MRTIKYIIIFLLLPFISFTQEDDLLSLIDQEENVDYTYASFKTNRIINLHSLENPAEGVLDFKISHRFNSISSGFYDLFGLDGASIRIGGDYGVNDRLAIGLGRSTIEKTYDGYFKYKVLRQSKGSRNMPISLAWVSATSISTIRWPEPDRTNYFSSRLAYVHQLIIGRKFSEGFTLQLSPTLVHKNLVPTNEDKNDIFSLAIGGRLKLTNRVTFNGEYIYVLPNQISQPFTNSLSIGFDIETGGHVFQLHFTNSRSMVEKGFITDTTGNWLDGDIHFGFNISRVFTLKKRKF